MVAQNESTRRRNVIQLLLVYLSISMKNPAQANTNSSREDWGASLSQLKAIHDLERIGAENEIAQIKSFIKELLQQREEKVRREILRLLQEWDVGEAIIESLKTHIIHPSN